MRSVVCGYVCVYLGAEQAVAHRLPNECHFLRWTWPAWHTFRTEGGLLLDVREFCPADVKAMAIRDCQRVQWEHWVEAAPERAELRPWPLLEPVQRWFRRHKRWDAGVATAAQAVTGGLWTQSRAHHRGLADSPNCLACERLGSSEHGDARHRLYVGACCKAQRDELPQTWLHMGASSTRRWDAS